MKNGEQWSQRGRKPQKKETRQRIHSGMKSFRKEKDHSSSDLSIFFFSPVILNHSSPVKPNINVTTTGILSEKLKATGENKGQIRRKQNCWRGRVLQCWVGLAPVWTEISGKLQLDILLFPFFFVVVFNFGLVGEMK